MEDVDGRTRTAPATGRRRFICHEHRIPAKGNRAGGGEFDTDKSQSNRNADGNSAMYRAGEVGQANLGNLASFRRNRGFVHCRPGRSDECRSDQDWFSVPLRSDCKIQSTAEAGRGTWERGALSRTWCLPIITGGWRRMITL